MYVVKRLDIVNMCNIDHLFGRGYVACNALRANRQLYILPTV